MEKPHARPFGHGMEENCSCPLGNRTDKALGYAVLLVGSHCAKCKLLLLFHAGLLEQFGGVDEIICLDVLDLNSKTGSKAFKF
jgi:hypothetical protein